MDNKKLKAYGIFAWMICNVIAFACIFSYFMINFVVYIRDMHYAHGLIQLSILIVCVLIVTLASGKMYMNYMLKHDFHIPKQLTD
jgi:hypothetical protein